MRSAPRPADAGPVLAIGRRAIVTSRKSGSGRVTLTDDGGTSPLATVAAGVEVEILAWRPRRNGTRYRVLSTEGVEGWVGAASLELRRPPAAPKPAGPRPAGPKAAAPKAAAPKLAAPKAVAPKLAAPKLAGPKPAGPKAAAPKLVVPKAAAPKSVAPRTRARRRR